MTLIADALSWALDEIDVLSNRLCGFAYPQGMAELGRMLQYAAYVGAVEARRSIGGGIMTPVAWQWRYKRNDGSTSYWMPILDGKNESCGNYETRPLYAAPVPAQDEPTVSEAEVEIAFVAYNKDDFIVLPDGRHRYREERDSILAALEAFLAARASKGARS